MQARLSNFNLLSNSDQNVFDHYYFTIIFSKNYFCTNWQIFPNRFSINSYSNKFYLVIVDKVLSKISNQCKHLSIYIVSLFISYKIHHFTPI